MKVKELLPVIKCYETISIQKMLTLEEMTNDREDTKEIFKGNSDRVPNEIQEMEIFEILANGKVAEDKTI